MTATFLNLTIHPAAGWSPEQTAAAEALAAALADDPAGAEVRLVDRPFPRVDPGADAAQVDRLADDLIAELTTAYDPARLVVHVMGEFTLTCALVARLQGLGVRTVASTTERIVTKDGDATTRRFAFRRFRDYPPLYATEAVAS